MQLVDLKLRDFKRFDTLAVEFGDGLNLLSGRNGAGKTSILEAIGFAMFGVPPARSEDQLAAVREGSDELTVELRFRHAETDYRLTRSLSPAGESAKLQKVGRSKPLATGVAAVASHLAELFGLVDERSLPRLFERLVGVAQGEVTRPFLLPSRQRAEHFEPLLNLDRYELAARRALALGDHFDGELREVEKAEESTKGEMKGYNSTLNRLQECESDRVEAAERREQLSGQLEQLAARSTELEAGRQSLQELTLEYAVLEESRRSRVQEEARAKERLEEAEHAQSVVETGREAFERWERLESECRALEVQRQECEALRTEVEALDKRLSEGREATDRERDALAQQLDDNQQNTEDLLSGRDALRARLDALRTRARKAEGTQNALAMAVARADKLRTAIAAVPVPATTTTKTKTDDSEAVQREREARAAEAAAAAAAAAAVNAELDALRARAATYDDSRAKLAEARASVASIEGLAAALDETIVALTPTHGACPYLKEPCSNIGGKSLVEHHERERDLLRASRATAEESIRYAEARVQEALQARRELQAKEKAAAAAAARAERASRPTTASGRDKPRQTPSPAPPGGGPRLDFDDLAHHLSGLAGVLGAIEPPAAREVGEPVALIGRVAGEGSATPLPVDIKLELPDLAEVERAQELAHQARQSLQGPAGGGRDGSLQETARDLANLVRRIHAGVTRADAQQRVVITRYQEAARVAEESLLDSTKAMEGYALDRARIREATKSMSTRDLGLLDTEIALSDRRVKLAAVERVEGEIAGKRTEQEKLHESHESYRAHALLAERVEPYRDEWKRLDVERLEIQARYQRIEEQLETARNTYDEKEAARLAREREQTHAALGEAKEAARSLEREKSLLTERLEELAEVAARLEELKTRRAAAESGLRLIEELAATYRELGGPMATTLREEVVAEANRLYRLVAGRAARLEWDQSYGLLLAEGSGRRPFAELARGEQTTAALAVTLALLGQFPDIGLLLLDEPTAHLDSDRRRALAEAIGAYRGASDGYLRQLVLVSHDDAFDHIAEHHTVLP